MKHFSTGNSNTPIVKDTVLEFIIFQSRNVSATPTATRSHPRANFWEEIRYDRFLILWLKGRPAYILLELVDTTTFLGPEKWLIPDGPKHMIGDSGVAQPSQSYLTADLKAKILQGDFAALAAARKNNQLDLQPNLTSMNQSKDPTSAGFVTVTNQSNGQKYRICASNSGWVWSYTTSMTQSVADDGNTTTQCVVQTGSYSKTGQILGLSYQTLTNMPTDLTVIGASVMVSLVVGNMVKQMVLGAIYQAAMTAAVDAAASGAVAGGFMIGETAALVGAYIISGLAAGVAGAIIAVIIFYLADFLHRSYGLTVQIYNWDTTVTWNVTDWYADNAVVAQGNAGSGPWKAVSLLPVQSKLSGLFKASHFY